MTATRQRALTHGSDLLASTQGSTSMLPDGDTFVGWGSQGDFSEVAPDGTLRFDAHLPDGYDTYRADRQPWTGTPDIHPSVAAVARAKRLHVHASWDGATQVASWQVLTGAGADALAPDGPPAPRRDLETAIALRRWPPLSPSPRSTPTATCSAHRDPSGDGRVDARWVYSPRATRARTRRTRRPRERRSVAGASHGNRDAAWLDDANQWLGGTRVSAATCGDSWIPRHLRCAGFPPA